MVGIVIVSHSRQLAQGVQELAAQMVQGKVPLVVAAGIDDPENPLGTDAMQVYEAITSVYSNEGVVVLMDLGSALMSAEMALEFLGEEERENVHLCEAPLVEGAIAAAVAAAAGNDIVQVMAEARGALAAKAAQLGLEPQRHREHGEIREERVGSKEIRLIVSNRLGLHARPAAQFVGTAARFQSTIRVRNVTKGSEFARADSINQVAMLGVRQGDEIAIAAQGVDADEALAALQVLVESNFGEDDFTPSPPPVSATEEERCVNELHQIHYQGELQGISASTGIAIAPLFHYQRTTLKVQQRPVEDVEADWQNLQTAIQTAREEIQQLRTQTATQIGEAEAAIFDAHLLFLEDPALIDAVHQHIFTQHLNAEAAWQVVVDELANNYRNLEDSYLQARAGDIIDVGQRVLRKLAGTTTTSLNLSQPAILVATDLTPSDTAQLDRTKVLGICTTLGSATSHTAILARTLGIPAVVGVTAEILQIADDTLLAIDGEAGKVWVEPDADILATLAAKRDVWQTAQQQALATAHQPAVTRDGRRVTVLANIASIADAQVAVNLGAEGVGLLRTEFLYLDRTTAPSEDEQLAVYQEIAQVLDSRPLIIRTLDIGGDKPLPYLNLPPETNPFLGLRGIRFCLHRPELFKIQLRAILRASVGHNIKIMFPMIATVGEVRAAKAILAEVQAELRQAAIPFDQAMQIGIMVEVPSAVAIADQLAAEVDFFSIGTNDLSQYVMACDGREANRLRHRTNPRVANLANALHPAVLRMIQQTVQAGHQAGIWVGLCGELAADKLAVPILLGLGLNELSLNPQAIPELKQAIAQLTLDQAQAIVQTVLKLDSADLVLELLKQLATQ